MIDEAIRTLLVNPFDFICNHFIDRARIIFYYYVNVIGIEFTDCCLAKKGKQLTS